MKKITHTFVFLLAVLADSALAQESLRGTSSSSITTGSKNTNNANTEQNLSEKSVDNSIRRELLFPLAPKIDLPLLESTLNSYHKNDESSNDVNGEGHTRNLNFYSKRKPTTAFPPPTFSTTFSPTFFPTTFSPTASNPWKKPSHHPTRHPTPSPSHNQQHDKCTNDDDYWYHNEFGKDCNWVRDNHHCDRYDEGKYIGKELCRRSCNWCDHHDNDYQDDDQCHDDNHYRYHNHDEKDCNWVKSNQCCDRFSNGKHIGRDFCPKSCDYCRQDDWSSSSDFQISDSRDDEHWSTSSDSYGGDHDNGSKSSDSYDDWTASSTPKPTPAPIAIDKPPSPKPTSYPMKPPSRSRSPTSVAPPTYYSAAPTIRSPPTNLRTLEDIICDPKNEFEFFILCAAFKKRGIWPILLDQTLVTLFAPTDDAFLRYFNSDKSVASMKKIIGDIRSDTLDSTNIAAAADTNEFNNDNGFSIEDVLLLQVAPNLNSTTEDLQCNAQITTLLSGQSTTTECISGGSSLVTGEISYIKSQVGNGQPSNTRRPEIISEITGAVNGMILVVNNVIIPGKFSDSYDDNWSSQSHDSDDHWINSESFDDDNKQWSQSEKIEILRDTTDETTTLNHHDNNNDNDNEENNVVSCLAHSQCVDLNLQGACCPTDSGMYLDCCHSNDDDGRDNNKNSKKDDPDDWFSLHGNNEPYKKFYTKKHD